MANRSMTQFFYSMHKMPVFLDCDVTIGAAGAVSSIAGTGIKSVTLLATGVYQIQFQDNYYRAYDVLWSMQAPPSGTTVTDGAFVVGTVYQIITLGTTNWTAAGLPVGITPAVGQVFKAATVGGAGGGTVNTITSSGVFALEIQGNPSTMLNPQPSVNQGGYLTIKCLNAAGAAVAPANGTVMGLDFYLSNSSVQVQGD